MTLKGHSALCFKTHTSSSGYLLIISHWKLLSAGKIRCLARFPCGSAGFLLILIMVSVIRGVARNLFRKGTKEEVPSPSWFIQGQNPGWCLGIKLSETRKTKKCWNFDCHKFCIVQRKNFQNGNFGGRGVSLLVPRFRTPLTKCTVKDHFFSSGP